MANAFENVFSALRALLQRHAGQLEVSEDTPMRYCLQGGHHPKQGKPIQIAWVEVQKNYVSFHHMGVYACPDLINCISTKLKARMHGKSCFNFTSVDEALFAELEELTVRAMGVFQKLPITK